jgi:hypothetical protein
MMLDSAVVAWLMYVFRPRALRDDPFLREEIEAEEPGDFVNMDDLNSWTPTTRLRPQSALADWHEGIKLPREPRVIASPMERTLLQNDQVDTTVTDLQVGYTDGVEGDPRED